MASTTVPEVKKTAPVSLTPNAVTKVKEIMGQQNPVPAGLRIGVVGGGCSGFSYSMQFENGAGMMDKTFEMDGLKVYVDARPATTLGSSVSERAQDSSVGPSPFPSHTLRSRHRPLMPPRPLNASTAACVPST